MFYLRKKFNGGTTQWVLPLGVCVRCAIQDGYLIYSTDRIDVCRYLKHRLKFQEYMPQPVYMATKRLPPKEPPKVAPKPKPRPRPRTTAKKKAPPSPKKTAPKKK
jgi:hypothetical protein